MHLNHEAVIGFVVLHKNYEGFASWDHRPGDFHQQPQNTNSLNKVGIDGPWLLLIQFGTAEGTLCLFFKPEFNAVFLKGMAAVGNGKRGIHNFQVDGTDAVAGKIGEIFRRADLIILLHLSSLYYFKHKIRVANP